MPYKYDDYSLKIPKELDGRRKLTEADIKSIKAMYKSGNSVTKIAEFYKGQVTRRSIYCTINPEKCEQSGKARWRKHYDKTKHAAYMKKYRHRKQKLYLDKKLEGQ